MQLQKKGHACVRLTLGDSTLVIDPGVFTEPDALDGAQAVLVTHEHLDHVDAAQLQRSLDESSALEVWAPASVAEQLTGRVHTTGEGDVFTAAGLEVSVHGTWHATIHPDIPRVTNVGYLVSAGGGGSVFHPGDAFTVPGVPVETLLLPAHAPWSKVGEIIDYVREVGATRAYAVHDGLLNDLGLGVVGRLLGPDGPGVPTPYERLVPGSSVEV